MVSAASSCAAMVAKHFHEYVSLRSLETKRLRMMMMMVMMMVLLMLICVGPPGDDAKERPQP